jgi:hypothetical protein
MKISDITVNPSLLEKVLYWVNPGVYVRNHIGESTREYDWFEIVDLREWAE